MNMEYEGGNVSKNDSLQKKAQHNVDYTKPMFKLK